MNYVEVTVVFQGIKIRYRVPLGGDNPHLLGESVTNACITATNQVTKMIERI